MASPPVPGRSAEPRSQKDPTILVSTFGDRPYKAGKRLHIHNTIGLKAAVSWILAAREEKTGCSGRQSSIKCVPLRIVSRWLKSAPPQAARRIRRGGDFHSPDWKSV